VVRLVRAQDRKRAKVSSTYLVADPSFLTGIARTLDLWGSLDSYNVSRTPQQADALALRSDWKIVGREIGTAAKSQRATVGAKRTVGNE
jgi:hypothetical protein